MIPLPQKSALQSEDSDWRLDIPSKPRATAVEYKCELAVRPMVLKLCGLVQSRKY